MKKDEKPLNERTTTRFNNLGLSEFLDVEGKKQNKFAQKAGISAATMTNILKGKDFKLSIASAIVKASNGIISYDGLVRTINKAKKHKKEPLAKLAKASSQPTKRPIRRQEEKYA